MDDDARILATIVAADDALRPIQSIGMIQHPQGILNKGGDVAVGAGVEGIVQSEGFLVRRLGPGLFVVVVGEWR